MAKIPWVNKDECIGCGLCVSNCPDVFRMDVDDKAECFDGNGATEAEIQSEAIDACPVSCIHWTE